MARPDPTAENVRRQREERARARATWPVRKTTLDAHGDEDLSECTTADERLAMMGRLARDAWASTGAPWPTYARADMPGRIFRNGHGRAGP